MTGSKASRGELSPSLFPFLAVLLCTVGALVLILVLVVGQSQASVKVAVDARTERAEELKAQVESIRDSFKDERAKIQLEIEKKRLNLQGLEKQTTDLAKELEQLNETSKLIDQQLTSDESTETLDESLTELQKQLQDAAEKLNAKRDKPSNEKPVFAIIPYEGSSGTHRRPIYLECRADGIVLQPEGVLIPLKDLKPPYGPGNPLDAALRTVRTHYAPKDGALNSSAYPLLVVRSSGIRTYALARMAMTGWDDQFGYELIEDDMELSFPVGEPALGRELEQTLVAARHRQAALVMAMPGRYRQVMEELGDDQIDFEDGGNAWNAAQGNGDGPAGDEPRGNTGQGKAGLGNDAAGGGDLALASNAKDVNGFAGPNAAGGLGGIGDSPEPIGSSKYMPSGRGGFAFAPDGSSGNGSSNRSGVPGNSGNGLQGFATGGDAAWDPSSAGGGSGSFRDPAAEGWNSTGQPVPTGGSEGSQSFAEAAFSGNQFTRAGQSPAGGSQTSGEGGGQLANAAGDGNATASGSNRPGTFRDAMEAARSKQRGSPDSQNSQAQRSDGTSAADSGTGGSQIPSPRSEGFGSVSANGNEVNAATSLSPSVDLSQRKKHSKEDADAVAKRKGRNWAWSAGPARETAVVRAIRIVCYEDRWIVLPDQAGKDKPQTIMLDVSLQTCAEELAKVIAVRVDRWGFALASGYWKPILQVEVAQGGERRLEQLKRLLDGSGLEIQLAASPQSRPATR